MAQAARSRTQNPEGKWGRKENLTHVHQKNAKESKKPEEGFALMDFQPRGVKQNGMRNPDETRSDVKGEATSAAAQPALRAGRMGSPQAPPAHDAGERR